MNYWEECVSEAFDDVGIKASKIQIETVASCVEGAHENYGMANGHDCIPNPEVEENKKLTEQLAAELSKITCPECSGVGTITSHGPCHSATSNCYKCRGEGRILP